MNSMLQAAPSLDTWTSVFLFAVGMGLFLFLMLLNSRQKRNLPIAFLVLAFSLILFQYVLFWTNYQDVIPYFVILPPVCYYTTGPLLYLYMLQLHKKRVNFNYALHFLPAFIILIPTLILWLKYLGFTEMKLHLLWLAQQHWFIVAHMLFYTFLIFKLLMVKETPINQFQAIRKRWTRVLGSLYLVFILAYASYYILVRFPFFSSEWDYAISITMSIAIYTIGYFTIKEPQVFDGEFYTQLFMPTNQKADDFEQALMNELYEKLKHHMEMEKPYIDNELRLVNLADQLGFSTHLLSKVINKKSGMNFNQFVNDYRLDEAERLLSEENLHSIKSIYFDVGFNNKATFYNAFKKKFQCTPLQYKERALQS